jgi:hypothetical protein
MSCFDDIWVQLVLGHELHDKICESDKIILTKGGVEKELYSSWGEIVKLKVEFCWMVLFYRLKEKEELVWVYSGVWIMVVAVWPKKLSVS